MKKLFSALLVLSILLAFSACGSGGDNKGYSSGTKSEADSTPESAISIADVTEQRPTADGQSIDVGDLHFYLPEGFKPHSSNVYNGAQRYYSGLLTDITKSTGVMITINTYNPKEGFDLENYVLRESMASMVRADMHATSFNGALWYSGVGMGKNYYYGLYNDKLYEVIFESANSADENSVYAARNMLEAKFYFAQSEEESNT